MIAVSFTDPLSLLLVVAVIVLCVTTVAMIVGGAGRASSGRQKGKPARLGAVPVVPLITATPRRSRPIPAHHQPIVGEPARQSPDDGDGRARDAVKIEEAQALIDHLAATNPERLAEIITQWIHEDDTTTRDRR